MDSLLTTRNINYDMYVCMYSCFGRKNNVKGCKLAFQGIWVKWGYRKSDDVKCGLCSERGHLEHILASFRTLLTQAHGSYVVKIRSHESWPIMLSLK